MNGCEKGAVDPNVETVWPALVLIVLLLGMRLGIWLLDKAEGAGTENSLKKSLTDA